MHCFRWGVQKELSGLVSEWWNISLPAQTTPREVQRRHLPSVYTTPADRGRTTKTSVPCLLVQSHADGRHKTVKKTVKEPSKF